MNRKEAALELPDNAARLAANVTAIENELRVTPQAITGYIRLTVADFLRVCEIRGLDSKSYVSGPYRTHIADDGRFLLTASEEIAR